MRILFCIVFLTSLLSSFSTEALPFGRFSSQKDVDCFFHKQRTAGLCEFEKCNWSRAVHHLGRIATSFPDEPCIADIHYYLGIALYNLKDYDLANYAFSNYLNVAMQPQYFEEVIQYKFNIAEAFRCGTKRRLCKHRCLPKWFSGRTLALTIYDEVIATLPSHPLAAESLFSKGILLQSMGEYWSSVEEFQSFIRRFPKDEKTPLAFIMISKNYYMQSCIEVQNPDLLALARINAQRFAEAFPKDEQIATVECYTSAIEEVYAKGLYSIGNFYERVKKPFAAVLYYRSAIAQFPSTQAAERGRGRICYLGYEVESVPDCSESTHM